MNFHKIGFWRACAFEDVFKRKQVKYTRTKVWVIIFISTYICSSLETIMWYPLCFWALFVGIFSQVWIKP